jgi:hypothetical protein
MLVGRRESERSEKGHGQNRRKNTSKTASLPTSRGSNTDLARRRHPRFNVRFHFEADI